jgi:hypothetical protein
MGGAEGLLVTGAARRGGMGRDVIQGQGGTCSVTPPPAASAGARSATQMPAVSSGAAS